ncbi:MAG: flavin reductase family protein [Anaerolineales bacterium]|jgi:flavin reductase (DIM6/NTAB) family NADH-FMN oxidoreductase RutF
MDTEAKKKALRSLTYGLYVLGSALGEEMAAGTVNWVSQASFSPPLIMVAVKADSHIHSLIERSLGFGLSVLSSEQKEIASAFFRATQRDADKINGYSFERGPQTGAPLLLATPYWLEAHVLDSVRRGDHTIFVAEIVQAGVRQEKAKPLVMWDTGWFYGG